MEEVDAFTLLGIGTAILVLSKLRKRRERKRRSIWMRDFFRTRNFGLVSTLHCDDILFKNFTRMSQQNFKMLLEMVRPKIERQDSRFRDSLPPDIKLAITIRYLATGDSLSSLVYLFKVSKQFISATIPVVLKAIIDSLQGYMRLPTNEQQWKIISEEFSAQWNFPNCVGALDGKHVVIQRPENTVGEFYNYKGTNSIVLMAIANANYNFIYVNVGCQGRISDRGVFKNSEFNKRIENKTLNLPDANPLPGRTRPTPYVLVADDAFPLTNHIMKPYTTGLNRGSWNRVFNYRLSRARRVVENAFGLLASVFRVFRKPIEMKVESTVIDIVLACVLLHNFLRSQSDALQCYSPRESIDREDPSTGCFTPGSWRRVTAGDTGLMTLTRGNREVSKTAQMARNEFKEYFVSPQGFIPNQNKYL